MREIKHSGLLIAQRGNYLPQNCPLVSHKVVKVCFFPFLKVGMSCLGLGPMSETAIHSIVLEIYGAF